MAEDVKIAELQDHLKDGVMRPILAVYEKAGLTDDFLAAHHYQGLIKTKTVLQKLKGHVDIVPFSGVEILAEGEEETILAIRMEDNPHQADARDQALKVKGHYAKGTATGDEDGSSYSITLNFGGKPNDQKIQDQH